MDYLHPSRELIKLGVGHHLEVIGTGATFLPAGNSTNIGVSHHLGVIRNMCHIHTTQQSGCMKSSNISWYYFYTLVLLRQCPTSLPNIPGDKTLASRME